MTTLATENRRKAIEAKAKELMEALGNEEIERRKKRITRNNAENSQLSQMLADRAVAKQEEFNAKGEKETGISSGYVASEIKTGKTFLLKHFFKSHKDCARIKDPKARGQAIQDRIDGVRELLGSAMYQFLLYDRAPKEALVTPDPKNPNSLYVRSKFFENAEQMSVFSGGTTGGRLNPMSRKIKSVEGLEKIIAACHILGEVDYHAGNIMVQTHKDSDGKDHKIFTKIDHGRSFLAFHQDFASMLYATANTFNEFDYTPAILRDNFPFNVGEYSSSLKQMVNQLEGSQFDAIIDQKIAELKKAGFDPKSMSARFRFVDDPLKVESKEINNFEDLSSVYKDLLKKNLSNMKEISAQVEIVAKFSNVTPGFKNAGWLLEMNNSPYKDPVAYAAHHNIQIEGKDALVWARDNNYKAKVPTKKQEVTEQEAAKWVKGKDGRWTEANPKKDPEKEVVASIDNLGEKLVADKEITKDKIEKFFNDVFDILKKENYLTDGEVRDLKAEPDFKKYIEDTTTFMNTDISGFSNYTKLNFKIAGFCKGIGCSSLAENYTIPSGYFTKMQNAEKDILEKIDTPTPVVQVKPDKNADERVYNLIEKCSRDRHLRIGTKLSEDEVKQFYNNVLEILKNENYLTGKEVNDIKKDPGFEEYIKDTTAFMNIKFLDSKNLQFLAADKIDFEIAGFCKEIGCNSLAERFRENIPLEKLAEMQNTKKDMMEATDITTAIFAAPKKPAVKRKTRPKLPELTAAPNNKKKVNGMGPGG